MWALILNQPEIYEYPKLRQCLLGNLNFEMVYHIIAKNEKAEFGAEEQKAFDVALERAYEHLHLATCKDFQQHAYQLCRVFVSRFTLNQDLFLERHFSMGNCNVSTPGLHGKTWFHARSQDQFEVESVNYLRAMRSTH